MQPVWATFAFKELGPETATLLQLMCFLDPDTITETIFTSVFPTPKAKDISNIIEGFPTNLMDFLNARSELLQSSLIRRNSELKELAVHRIVQDAALISLDSDRVLAAFQSSLRLLSIAWPTGGFDYNVARWKQCEVLYPHIFHLKTKYNVIQTLQENYDFAVEFGKLLADAAWSVINNACFLRLTDIRRYRGLRGAPSEALAFLDLAQTLLENAPTEDTLALAFVYWAQTEIACLTGQNGLPQAMKCLELCQSVDFADYPNESSTLPVAYHEVGEALTANRSYEEALTYDEQACTLHMSVPGWDKDFETIVNTRVNMAFCLWRIGGEENIAKAERMMEEALEVRAKAFGKDDTNSTK